MKKISAFEDEREISEEQFRALAENIKEGTVPVKKTRYTISHEKKTFEIDVYPQWKRTAIMEVELSDRKDSVLFPSFIKIKREVSGIREYSNASMSKSFPEEDA